MLEHGAFGVRYIPLAPVSKIAVSEGVILGGRVGLQLELGKTKDSQQLNNIDLDYRQRPPPFTTRIYPNLCSCFDQAQNY